jgi:hypothetical protein
MEQTPRHGHDLAFYVGLNAALIVVIASAIYIAWPL